MDMFEKMNEALNYLNEVREFFGLSEYNGFNPDLGDSEFEEVNNALERYEDLYSSYYSE